MRKRLALLFGLLVGCPETPATPDRPEPMKEPLIIEGWPGPLRPLLDPKDGVVVRLRPEPSPEVASSAKCVLPPQSPVAWSRSRVRVERRGVLRANEAVEMRASKINSLDALTPDAVSGFGEDLRLEKGEGRIIAARFAGRCIIEDKNGWQAADCSGPKIEVVYPPVQSWWLEVACSAGEGWFEVEPEKFEVEHYLD